MLSRCICARTRFARVYISSRARVRRGERCEEARARARDVVRCASVEKLCGEGFFVLFLCPFLSGSSIFSQSRSTAPGHPVSYTLGLFVSERRAFTSVRTSRPASRRPTCRATEIPVACTLIESTDGLVASVRHTRRRGILPKRAFRESIIPGVAHAGRERESVQHQRRFIDERHSRWQLTSNRPRAHARACVKRTKILTKLSFIIEIAVEFLFEAMLRKACRWKSKLFDYT